MNTDSFWVMCSHYHYKHTIIEFSLNFPLNSVTTRMHTSRKRTVRKSIHLLSEGAGWRPPLEQAPPPGADPAPPQSSPPPGPGTPQEQAPPGPAPPLETCCKACWDTTCNACWDSTPPMNRMTDRCKNITFATSLRTVIIFFTRLKELHLPPLV